MISDARADCLLTDAAAGLIHYAAHTRRQPGRLSANIFTTPIEAAREAMPDVLILMSKAEMLPSHHGATAVCLSNVNFSMLPNSIYYLLPFC